MKKLTTDQKEQIIIYTYENWCIDDYEYPYGVNATLEALGYEDRLKFDLDKGIFKWSSIHDH